jgi:hypothetical protein
MSEISVRGTIRSTWKYVLENWRSMLGATWIAALVSVLAPDFLARLLQLMTPNMGRFWMDSISLVLTTALYSVAAIAIVRHVLGLKAARAVHFTFGRAESWLSLGTVLCSILATVMIAVVSVLTVVLSAIASAPVWLSVTIVLTFAVVVLMFIAVRYLFFLPLAAVLSPNDRLSRSYDLSAGIGWSILGIEIGLVLPIVAIALAFFLLSMLITSYSALHLPSDVRDWSAMMKGVRTNMEASPWVHVPELVIQIITTTLFWAVSVTAAVIIYRTLSPEPPASFHAGC